MKSVRIGAILAATIAVVGAAGASSATAQDAARDTAHVTAQAKPRPTRLGRSAGRRDRAR